MESWITELLERVGAGETLSANDGVRLPVALQLQAQRHTVELQAQAEAAAAQARYRRVKWVPTATTSAGFMVNLNRGVNASAFS